MGEIIEQGPLAQVKVENNIIKIDFTSLVDDPSNPFCPQVKIPFLETIPIGVLKEGSYKIVANSQSTQPETPSISIEAPTRDGNDKYIYARVEEIFQ